MPAYSPRTRQAAQAGSTAADWAQAVTNLIGLAYVAASEELLGAYLIFCANFMGFVSRGARRIANDPAAEDFDSNTRVRRLRVNAEALATDDPIGAPALNAAAAADVADAYLAAHLRAFERYQGAVEHGRTEDAAARAKEAISYAREAATPLRTTADSIAALADNFSTQTDQSRQGEIGEPQKGWVAALNWNLRSAYRQPESLPDTTLARLYVGGVRIEELRNLLRQRRRILSVPTLLERLSTAPEPLTTFGNHMAEWELSELAPDESA